MNAQEWIERACHVRSAYKAGFNAPGAADQLLDNKPNTEKPKENEPELEEATCAYKGTFPADENVLVIHYEFKPCPFCKSKPELLIKDSRKGQAQVDIFCYECSAVIGSGFCSDVLSAIDFVQHRWNRREGSHEQNIYRQTTA